MSDATLQGYVFRGQDESSSSSNRMNFLELVKDFAKMNTKIDEVVLENAPKIPIHCSRYSKRDFAHYGQ